MLGLLIGILRKVASLRNDFSGFDGDILHQVRLSTRCLTKLGEQAGGLSGWSDASCDSRGRLRHINKRVPSVWYALSEGGTSRRLR